jgi:hypothetical protein
MLKCAFTFGQLEELLATVHHIAPDRKIAFQGRLKHLQRWGFPTREKPGKGKAIAYTIEHVLRAVVALELIQAGINPKFAIDMVEANWSSLLPTVYLNSFTVTERVTFGGGSEHDWCWLIRPEALRGLTVDGESEYDKHEAIHAISAENLARHLTIDSSSLGPQLGSHWRNVIINGGPLVRGVLSLIELRFGWADRDDLIGDLKSILDDQQAEFDSAFAALGDNLADAAKKVRQARADRGADLKPYCDLHPELISEAQRLIGELPRNLLDVLSQPIGSKVELSKDDLTTLADNRLLRIEAEELSMTPLFFVASELLKEQAS